MISKWMSVPARKTVSRLIAVPFLVAALDYFFHLGIFGDLSNEVFGILFILMFFTAFRVWPSREEMDEYEANAKKTDG